MRMRSRGFRITLPGFFRCWSIRASWRLNRAFWEVTAMRPSVPTWPRRCGRARRTPSAVRGPRRLGDDRLLAGDLPQLRRRLLQLRLVFQGLAHAHVDDDLLQARQAELVLAAELLRQERQNFLVVLLHQPGHDRTSCCFSRR